MGLTNLPLVSAFQQSAEPQADNLYTFKFELTISILQRP